MNQLIKMLQEAVGTGEIITVAYGGGSRPGQPRQLTVMSCTGTEAHIREIENTTPKQYKFNKVLWVEGSSGQRITSEENTKAFIANPPPTHLQSTLPALETLDQYAAHLRCELEQAGWYLHQRPDLLGVGVYLKNGKPKKNPAIAVTYQDRSTETIWDLEKNDFVTRQRETSARDRPWRVDSERFSGKTFSQLSRAMELFITEVRASSPQQPTKARK